MGTFHFAVHHIALSQGEIHRLDPGHHALRVLSGTVDLSEHSHAEADGFYCDGGIIEASSDSVILDFSVAFAPAGRNAVLSHSFDWQGDAVLRLDQVDFPPGACAYRHVHPGPGIRFLIGGELEILSDDHREVMHPQDAWFEDANSPVQATAGNMETAFVRAMVLPPAYHAKPTLRLLDKADEKRPRLQTNRRFFDQKLSL